MEMYRAELYAKHAEQAPRDVAQMLSEFIHKMSWRKGERVLDVGCGPGNVTTEVLLPLLPADFDLLVGLDVSPQMIQYATKTYTHSKLRFAECDVTKDKGKIPGVWPPGFDKVFSFHCLHWVQDHRKAINNIYKFLRTGGETFIMFFGKLPIYDVYETQSRKPEWKTYLKDVREFVSPYHHSEDPAQEFNNLLLDTGFEVIDCECRHIEFTFETANHFKDLMKAVSPFTDRMPTELREQYITDLEKEMRKLALKQAQKDKLENSITYGYEMVVAYATKN